MSVLKSFFSLLLTLAFLNPSVSQAFIGDSLDWEIDSSEFFIHTTNFQIQSLVASLNCSIEDGSGAGANTQIQQLITNYERISSDGESQGLYRVSIEDGLLSISTYWWTIRSCNLTLFVVADDSHYVDMYQRNKQGRIRVINASVTEDADRELFLSTDHATELREKYSEASPLQLEANVEIFQVGEN